MDVEFTIRKIIEGIVFYPTEIRITKISPKFSHTVIYELRVNKKDLGIVIGKRGKMAKALRIYIAALSAKNHRHFILDIIS